LLDIEFIAHKSADSEDLLRYENYARSELPRRVRQMVEDLIRSQYGPIEDSVKAQLAEITRKCQEEVFLSFRISQLEASDSQHEPASTTNPQDESLLGVWEPIFAPPPPMPSEIVQPTMREVETSLSRMPGIEPVHYSDSGYGSQSTILDQLKFDEHQQQFDELLNLSWNLNDADQVRDDIFS